MPLYLARLKCSSVFYSIFLIWVSALSLYPPQGLSPEKGLSLKWCFIYSGVRLNLFIILGHVRFPSCVSHVDRSAGNWNSLYARVSL